MAEKVGESQAPLPEKAHSAADPAGIPEAAHQDSGNWLMPSATAPNRGKCRDRLSELRKSRNFETSETPKLRNFRNSETPKLRKAETSKLPKPGNARKRTQEVGESQAPRPEKAHLAADTPGLPETAFPDSGNRLFPIATAPNRGKCRDRVSELRKS